jgi:prophage DNA circulation protein
MGQQPGVWNVQAYLIGENFIADSEALMAALNKPGPGTLVHPQFGSLKVQPGTFTRNYQTHEGGHARLYIQFYPDGSQVFPTASIATQQATAAKADALNAAAKDDFIKKFVTSGYPDWVATKATAIVNDATNTISNIANSFPKVPAYASAFEQSVMNLQSSVTSLIANPASLSNSIGLLIFNLSNLAGVPSVALSAYQSMFTYGSSLPGVPQTTGARIQQALNQAAFIALVSQAALAEAARATSMITPASSQDAIALRNSMADSLSTAAQQAPSGSTWQALTDLRVATIQDLTTRAATLPQVASFTPQTTMPSVLVAQRLFGDASQAGSIVARNNISNPGFIAGGSPLEYLQ